MSRGEMATNACGDVHNGFPTRDGVSEDSLQSESVKSDRKFETSETSGSIAPCAHFNSNNGTDVISTNDIQVMNALSRESLSDQEELGKPEAGVVICNKKQPEIDPDLLTRPSWSDASFALSQIKEGNAKGKVYALVLRAKFHTLLFRWGCFIQRHTLPVMLVGIIVLAACATGLLSARLETDLEKLWVETGGELEEELRYSREALNNIGNHSSSIGSSYELLIQTGFDTLTVESMSLHLKAALAATNVTVEENDVIWRFSDFCQKQNFDIDGIDPLIQKVLLHFSPCMIIGPLDCFWEGSKLLEPPMKENSKSGIQTTWKNVNPIELLGQLSLFFSDKSTLNFYKDMLLQAGVTSGYTKRWCLDPHDEECPEDAPNFKSKQAPDVKAIVSAGCTGFATELMKWPLDLIVGGIHRNENNTLTRAEGLETLFEITSEKNFYEAHKGKKKAGENWSQERADRLLLAWQRKFVDVIFSFSEKEVVKSGIANNSTDQLFAFSFGTTVEVLEKFSQIGIGRIVGGYVLMIVYAYFTLMRFNPSQSQGSVGVAGVLLVLLSVAAGLGISSAVGISFNAASTQVLPFLLLGLGVDDMFLMVHQFGEISISRYVPYKERVGECLKRVGVSVALTSVAILSGFLFSLIIPMPALRHFGLQAAIVTLFNLATVLTIFPAFLSLDLKRRERNKYDLLCCFTSSSRNHVCKPKEITMNATTIAPQLHQSDDTSVANGQIENGITKDGHGLRTNNSNKQLKKKNSKASKPSLRSGLMSMSLSQIGQRYYAPFLVKTPVQVLVIAGFGALLGVSIYGCTQVRDGLDLGDVLPRKTREHKALVAQTEYFSFYNIYIVTQDFDYPANQAHLHRIHNRTGDLKYIIRNTDGSLTKFWLQYFRDWLKGLQDDFDKDWARGSINSTGWNKNASTKSVLAYKLLAQTGKKGKEAIDKTRIGCVLPATNCSKPDRTRLVSNDGIINEDAFYNYLTAWVASDPLNHGGSLSEMRPQPISWSHNRDDENLVVPPSAPLIFTRMPFYLKDMRENEDFVYVINWIRGLLDEITQNTPVRAYPNGYPFTFWQQYITLRFWLFISLGCVIAAVFLVLSLVLMNPWAASIMALFLAMIACELMGFMGAAGVKLSAVPAVILVAAIGLGVEFTVHITFAFITSCGTRKHRVIYSIGHMIGPVVDGAISTLLGVIMLAWAEFDIIVTYFFQVLAILIFLGVLNGLVLLPVVLSLIGPSPEVVPKDGGSSLQTNPPSSPPETHSLTSSDANSNNSNNNDSKNKGILNGLFLRTNRTRDLRDDRARSENLAEEPSNKQSEAESNGQFHYQAVIVNEAFEGHI